MASAYASELVNTVLRALRQQMLNDGWISELELQFAGPSLSEPVFDFKENAANQRAHEFDDLVGAQLPGALVRKGKMKEISVKEIGLYKKTSRAEAMRGGMAIVLIKRPKQAKGEMQTCWKRAASEDEGNLARARTLQFDASVGELQSVVGTFC